MKPGLMQVVARRSVLRLTLFVALFSLLSLQLVASDHWHGISDTEHCQVCVQGGNAPLAQTIEIPLPTPSAPRVRISTVDDVRATVLALPAIRGPPAFT